MSLQNIDVLPQVLRHLDTRSYFHARQVCREWRNIANKPINLWWHISEKLLEPIDKNQSDEHDDFLKTLETLSGGYNTDSYQLIEIYLDLVRFKMVLYDISISKEMKLSEPNESELRTLSPDGTILLSAVSGREGNVDISLLDVLTGKKQSFKHINRRCMELITLSTDNKFIAISSSYGYLEVLKLEQPQCPVIYQRQYPSHFESIAVSKGGEVFMGKSIRLGGYSVVNLDTGEEIDINHYRLDLSLQSLFNDLVLILPGKGETFIYGWPSKNSSGERGQLWRYYEYLIRNDIFYYVARPRAIPLPLHRGYFLIISKDETSDGYQLALIQEEYQPPPGFKEITEFSNKRSASEMEEEEKGLNGGKKETEKHDTRSEAEDNESREDETAEGENKETDDETDDDADDEEPNELILEPVSSLSSYCLSSNGSKLAIIQSSSISIYALHNPLYEAYGKWSYIPYRSFQLNDIKSSKIIEMKFINNDHIVLMFNDSIKILTLSIK